MDISISLPEVLVPILSYLDQQTIQNLARQNLVEPLSRGLYRLTERPPIRVFRSSGKALTGGVETHDVDGIPINVYSAAKTVVDCFKFRNKIGTNIAVEALRDYLEQKDSDRVELIKYAHICRVERVMTPYLETLL